jgi:hypothetical protein
MQAYKLLLYSWHFFNKSTNILTFVKTLYSLIEFEI